MSDEVERLRARAKADPMPAGFEGFLCDLIVPFTLQMEMEHDDAMSLLKIVYPVIKDWLFTQTVDWSSQIRNARVDTDGK
jgi:hypothetical protein